MDKEIKKEVYKILNKVGYSLPINVEYIAESILKIKIKEEPFDDDISGVLFKKKGDAIVGINRGHHKNRKRFTLAHEIGHYLLHNDIPEKVFVDSSPIFYRRTRSTVNMVIEKQANEFAAELLMPEELVKKEVSEHHYDLFDEEKVNELAKKFGVSVQALTIRLMKLKLIPPF